MDVKILSWNIRRFGHTYKKNFVKSFCKKHKPDILCLLEPMIQVQEQKFLKLLNFENVHVNVSNKIWVFASHKIKLDMILNEEQILICNLEHPAMDFRPMVGFVYAKNYYVRRRELWDHIKQNYANQDIGLLAGDFNCILSNEERIGTYRFNVGPSQDFKSCLEESNLENASFFGNRYTWSNGHVWKRLDRVLITQN